MKKILCWFLLSLSALGQSTTSPFAASSVWKKGVANLGGTFSSIGATLGTGNISYAQMSSWNSPASESLALYTAAVTDPAVTIYYGPNNYTNLCNGTWQSSGNSGTLETAIKASTTTTFAGYNMNTYSTTDVTGSTFVTPATASYHNQQNYYWNPTVQIPSGAVPAQANTSTGCDTPMTIFQPNGWAFECENSIILSANQGIVCAYASYTWPYSGGSGAQDGRRASMIPVYAGVIRNGEITSGTINHAVAVAIPPGQIKRAINWPAFTVDRSNSYGGSVIPYGALLAIPAGTSISGLGLLSTQGTVLAHAAQTYGFILVDQSSAGDFDVLTSLDCADCLNVYNFNMSTDIQTILNNLQLVSFPAQTGDGWPTPLGSVLK